MSKRWIAITAWLGAGHAILGGLYWLLLQVPESNTFMLTVSLLVAIGGLAGLGLVEGVGVGGFAAPDAVRPTLARGLRGTAWVLPALAVFVVMWLLTGFAGNWWDAHRGEADAWLILRFGWTKTDPLHTTVAWVVWFVRYAAGTAMAVALLAAAVCRGAAGVLSPAWLGRAFNWKTLVVTAAALLIGVWLPWHFIEWRPASLPNTWAQPTFATVKLFVFFIVMNTGWAVVLWWAARHAMPGHQQMVADLALDFPAATPIAVAGPAGSSGQPSGAGSSETGTRESDVS